MCLCFQKASHPTSSADSPDAGSQVMGPHCRARFDYDGGEPGDLTFVADDIIQLKEKVGEEWLKGSLRGHTGIFPVEYVEILVDLPKAELETASTGMPPPSVWTDGAKMELLRMGLCPGAWGGLEEMLCRGSSGCVWSGSFSSQCCWVMCLSLVLPAVPETTLRNGSMM